MRLGGGTGRDDRTDLCTEKERPELDKHLRKASKVSIQALGLELGLDERGRNDYLVRTGSDVVNAS